MRVPLLRSIFFGLLTCMLSCGAPKQIPAYFQGSFDTTAINKLATKELKIQPGDILYIGVTAPGLSAESNLQFNNANYNAGVNPALAQAQMLGFLVNTNGDIVYPQMGTLHVAGLTKPELATQLQQRLERFIKDPQVSVRFLNFKVTVLGEVSKPGTFTLQNEKGTLLDALGLAGDLTMYGRRDNVLLIRETNGRKDFIRLDITKTDVFATPYFNLQQNDVIYVEAIDYKLKNTDNTTFRNISLATGILTTIAILITALK